MRINPISMAYTRQNLKSQKQNNTQNQNVSFGKFQDEKTDGLTYKILEVDEDDTGSSKAAYEYFRDTLFATIKTAKDSQGKDFVYVVMNKDVTDKHKNKHRFDEMLEDARKNNDRFNKYLEKYGRVSKYPEFESGLFKKEPNFISAMTDFSTAYNIYEDLWKAEEDYNPPPSKPCEPEPRKEKWWEDPYERGQTLGY